MNTFSEPPWLDPILDGLEQKIEHPLGAGPFADPLGDVTGADPAIGLPTQNLNATGNRTPDMLDLVEASVEQLPSSKDLPEHLQDPLHDLLAELERQTEQQVIKPEKSEEDPPVQEDIGRPRCIDSFSKLPVPDVQGTSFVGNYPYQPRMGGRGAGIRNTGSEIEWCELRQTFVWPDDCESCEHAEMVDMGDDENEQRCRYTLAYLW